MSMRLTAEQVEDMRRIVAMCDPGVNEIAAECESLRAELVVAQAERNKARQFGELAAKQYNDLLATCAENTAVTCAFCGEVYPAGTPRHGDGLLAEHIKTCPQHPLRTAELALTALQQDRDALQARIDATVKWLELNRGLNIPEDGLIHEVLAKLQPYVSTGTGREGAE